MRGPASGSRIFSRATSDSYMRPESFERSAIARSGTAAWPRRIPSGRAQHWRGCPYWFLPRTQLAERRNHFGTDPDVGIDHLVVGIGEVRLDGRADPADFRCHARLDIPGEVEIDQAVGCPDLDLGVIVVRGFDQRVQHRLGASPISVRALTASTRISTSWLSR